MQETHDASIPGCCCLLVFYASFFVVRNFPSCARLFFSCLVMLVYSLIFPPFFFLHLCKTKEPSCRLLSFLDDFNRSPLSSCYSGVGARMPGGKWPNVGSGKETKGFGGALLLWKYDKCPVWRWYLAGPLDDDALGGLQWDGVLVLRAGRETRQLYFWLARWIGDGSECCEKGAAAVLGACCPDSSRQVVVSGEYVGVPSFARNLLFYCFTAFRCASRLGFFVFPFHYTMFSI